MPSRPACLVLGLGLGALIAPLAGLITQVALGHPMIYPKET